MPRNPTDPQRLRHKLADRLLAQREIDPATGCWVWCGTWLANGHGVLKLGETQRTVAHVAAWLWLSGFELGDRRIRVYRTCQIPACFNPEHLRPIGLVFREKKPRGDLVDLKGPAA